MARTIKPVIGSNPKERIDAALALPEQLTCADGRKFSLRSWNPSVDFDGVVTAEIEVLVEVPEDGADETVNGRE